MSVQRIEAESKSLPDKLKEVNAELAELTRKVSRPGAKVLMAYVLLLGKACTGLTVALVA